MKLKICLLLLSLSAVACASQPSPRLLQPTPAPIAPVAVHPPHVLTFRDYFHIMHSEEVILRDSARTDAERLQHEYLVRFYLLQLSGGGILRQSDLDRPYTGNF